MSNVTGIEDYVTNGGLSLSQNNPNPFAFGDMMEYILYATINGVEDTVTVTQQQTDAQGVVVPFETEQTDGLPCPGIRLAVQLDDGNTWWRS